MYGFILFVSLVAAIVPALLYLVVVRWLERLSREPLRLILLVMAWGAIGGTVVGVSLARFVEGAVMFAHPGTVSDIMEYAVLVPLAEEVAKGAVLVWLGFSPRLKTRANGLVYGAAVGLGFAITENLVYSIHVYQAGGVESWYVTLVLRLVFASTLHAIASALFGLAIAWGRVGGVARRRPVLGAFSGLLIAVAIHGSWNAVHFIGAGAKGGGAHWLAYAATPILVVLMVAITGWVLRRERQL